MSKESAKPPTLQWTGERYVPEIAGEIRLEHIHRYLIARELSQNKRVLDIACGEGYGSAMLASVASQVIGVDIAPEVVAHASRRYERHNLKFRYGSCEAIPLDDSSVDLVVSFETIEHIDSHEEMMWEIKRVLSPDGLLIISSPDRRQYSDALGNRNQYHKRELDRDEFDRLLRTHFSYVAMGGQRVRGGSIVAPLDVSTETRFVTFPSPDEGAVAVHGLDAPVYLLALASDQPVPALPVGLVDGGQFTWASDLGMYHARVQGHCAVEIGKRLGEVVQLDETSANALQAEFTRQADRVSELSQSIQAYHSLDARVGILVEHVAALSAQELNRQADRASELSQSIQAYHSLDARVGILVEHVAALSAQELNRQADRASELSQSIQAYHSLDARVGILVEHVAALSAQELNRQADRASELSQSIQTYHSLDARVGILVEHVAALSAQLGAFNTRLAETFDKLAVADAEFVAVRAVSNAHATASEGADRKVRRLESEIETGKRISQERESQFAERESQLARDVAHHLVHIALLQEQVDIYERSRSWRLTAPMRAARRKFGRALHRTKTYVDRVRHSVEPPSKGSVTAAGSDSTPVSSKSEAEADAIPAPLMEPSVGRDDALSRALTVRLPEETAADYVPLNRSVPVETRIKLIAFYLPQFHPIPENDAWWGRGFTEWTNVSRAKPQFVGHYQPHLPGELGFYDLRLVEVQRRQIELARLYGIHGFCFHHYWFGGTKLLHRPLDQFLAHPDLDFPFCLCWANENWTRKWDGRDDDVLIGQQHSPEDDLAFIRDIEPALRDPRYIRVDGRPLLMVYRPAFLPDASATAERWRVHCREVGLGELFLVSTHAFDHRDPREFGFDAATEFAPNNMAVATGVSDITEINPDFRGLLYDYRELVATHCQRKVPAGYPIFRCVTPMWDNEARRPSLGAVFAHSSPGLYRQWLQSVCGWAERHGGFDKPVVFVNAWNEWAEGAHLEPDQRYGYAYLQATAEALERFPIRTARASIVCVSHDALFYGAQVLALNLVRTLATKLHHQVDAVLCGPGPLKSEFEAVARVHDVSGPDWTRETRFRLFQQLYEDGARVAICNTSVVGEPVELLKLAGFSVVSLIHELPGLIQSYGLGGSIELIAEHADKVVFPANVVRDKFIELTGLPPERSVVQPQGLFAPNEFFNRRDQARGELRAQLGIADDSRVVLAIGNADHRKGIDLFVQVGIRVAQQLENVTFLWIGHQDSPAFNSARADVEQAGLEHRFVFPGPIRNSDLFFAGSDAYLMTSREDPFPNVVIQALDAALPVIGFEGGGGFVELLERGCGVLVPFADTRAMADELLRLLTTPVERERLAATAREILTREFSFVNYARTLVELAKRPGPKVSVIVPNFNYAKYLPTRLFSIITQTYQPHEVLFLDDCSSDDSLHVAAEMLHGSGLSYRIIANETNQGTYRQWLRGLREATGDLIWIAEADDDCAPDFLERLVARFDQPDVVLAYSQSRQIDAEGCEIAPDYCAYTADISETKWSADYLRSGHDEIRDTLVVKNTIPNVSAVLMRRADISGIEQKLLGLKNAGDWLLYVHLLRHGSLAFVSESLNSHRRHSASVTIGQGGQNLMREILLVQHYILERYEIASETERKRSANLQTTYEYLGFHNDGPASFLDHDALKVLE